jgi:hypothetical protein
MESSTRVEPHGFLGNSSLARCSKRCPRQFTRRTQLDGLSFITRQRLRSGIGRSSARASGAARGASIGQTAGRCVTMNAPWP